MSPALAKAFFIAKRRQKNAIKIIYFDSSSRDITTTTTTTTNNNHSLIRTSDEREKVRKLCEVAVRGGFCFPYDDEDDECRSTAGAKGGDRKTSFTFGLTDQDGKRFYGSVLKVVVDDDDDDSVFAVLSEFRYFDTFERAMNVVREYYVSKHFMNDDEGFKCFDDEESDLAVFLVALFGSSSSSRMLSRKTTSRRSSSSSTVKNRIISRASLDNKENEEEEEVIIVPSPNAEPSLRFRVPKNDEVEDLKCFDALLFGDDDNNKNENLVPIDGIVALLIALFFERRVVLTSASLSKLSRATHAANRMVFPLKWQHVFLPVVPIGLLEYLTAPMPFLVGLPLQSMKAYEELPKEEVFLLNLDDGSYTYFAEDFELVPKRIANRLRKTLEHERMLGRHRQNNNTHNNNNNITATMEETVSKAFRSFVSSAIGSYPRYVKSIALEKPPPEAITNDGLWLDQDAFVEGAPNHKTRLFRVSLRHTQMYEVFVRDRLAVCALAARSGKAQFGSDIKDADLDEESAFQAFGSEFQKEAKNVYRDVAEKSQRMAQISARSMKKGAKLVKEKFFMSFDAFKDRKTTKTLSSSSIEENGDFDWKKKVVVLVTTTEALDISSNNNKNDFEEEDDDDDDDATKLSELKRAEDKAKRRQRNNKDNNNLNLIDFFDEIPVASLAKETPTDSSDEAARNVSSLLDS